MIRFRDFQPTGFDSKLNYVNHGKSQRGHWYILEYVHSRDSDMLHESNWECIKATLQPNKTPGIELHTFNHWGCGWFELILIHPWYKSKIEAANDIESALADYPVLDENDLSKREMESQDLAWEHDIQHDLKKALNEALNVDCDEVEESNLFFYFRDLCDKTNTYFETDYQYGSSIDIESLMQAVTLESALLALPGIRIEASEWSELPHKIYHAIAKVTVGDKPREIFDLEGNKLEIPDFIAVQHDSRQLNLI